MEESGDIIELARLMPRDRFVRRVTNLLLVVSEAGADNQQFAFRTVAASPAAHRKPPPPPGPTSEVFEVAKAKGNPYPDQISVGRTRNCDVVLRHPSVSKLHAHFRQNAQGQLVLIDNGSQNGTRVNGKLLSENEPAEVAVGDVIQFGRLTASLLDAARLFDVVREQARHERDQASR
ncbi:FHA domain-containing protein [Sorangium cellulosum]|uniref:FHA domain-containing protein n=1 Tax=Sorangium cellulosum TaxID=56 RepID=UPI001F2619F2|nr:FHA domain-containing protein [Sorangium cellulosum]